MARGATDDRTPSDAPWIFYLGPSVSIEAHEPR